VRARKGSLGEIPLGPHGEEPPNLCEAALASPERCGKIYVVGGFGGERELEIYDSAADRWSRGASDRI
jgi:hypothetical protein